MLYISTDICDDNLNCLELLQE